MLIPRIFSAFIMLIIFLSSLFLFSGKFFPFIIYLTSLIALYEWSKLLKFNFQQKNIFLITSVILIYSIGRYSGDDNGRLILLLSSIFWVCVAPLFLIFNPKLKNFLLRVTYWVVYCHTTYYFI